MSDDEHSANAAQNIENPPTATDAQPASMNSAAVGSSATGGGGSGGGGTGLLGDVKIVDLYPEAERLIEAGAARLSRALVDTVQAQIEITTAECATLERVNAVVAAEYDKLHDGVASIGVFYRNYGAESG